LKKTVKSLIDALGLGPREHIALVGAGGKTTLMLSLGDELRRSGKRVIASTTTKVWHREALQCEKVLLVADDAAWEKIAKEELSRQGSVFVGRSVLDTGKVEGIPPSLADAVYRDPKVHHVLIEADGAAGHPLKAPAENEPVIPRSVTMVVAMMGLEALNARLDETTAFRVEQVRTVTGLDTGGVLTPSALSQVFLHPAGLFKGTPEGSRKVVFLNKGDLIKEEMKVVELADLLLSDRLKKIERVIVGSLKMGVYQIRTRHKQRII